MPCEFLSLEDLLDIVTALRIGPVRDLGLLNAAALRPQTTLMGQDAYPSTAAKAAALLESLAKNHALIDGNKNKRLAWAACSVFLSLNALEISETVSNDDVYDLVVAVAFSRVTLEQVCATLSDWTATRP
ncbi:type II toxin-antitoxin system death-on-curing family toxin [Actinomyces sp.]